MSIRCVFASRVLALLVAVSAASCATVRPYEREYLTRPGMDAGGDSDAAEFEAHVQSAREGAIGGHGTVENTGGGCGCN
ncbi:MAG: DUF4266 domain-containing protein [Polyangiales bacterium]